MCTMGNTLGQQFLGPLWPVFQFLSDYNIFLGQYGFSIVFLARKGASTPFSEYCEVLPKEEDDRRETLGKNFPGPG